MLMANLKRADSTTWQNPPICHSWFTFCLSAESNNLISKFFWTWDEVLLKRKITSPNLPNSTPEFFFAELTDLTLWGEVNSNMNLGRWCLYLYLYLSWSCTMCTLQTSFQVPTLQGWGQLVCKVHQVEFQPQCQQRGIKVPQSRAYKVRATWQASGWHWKELVKFLFFSGVLDMSTLTLQINKLDGVGPVDNTPFTD